LLLAVGLVAAGLALSAWRVPPGVAGRKAALRNQSPEASGGATTRRTPAAKARAGKTVKVAGRVLDPGGKPVAGARVAFLTSPGPENSNLDPIFQHFQVLAQTQTDDRGRFHFRAPRRTSPKGRAIPPGRLLAGRKGYGFGFQALQLDADQKDVTVRLAPEEILRGQVFDAKGKPVQGLKIRVEAVADDKGKVFRSADEEGEPVVWLLRPAGRPTLWPRPLVTDARGRFAVPGVGRGQRAFLLTQDDRFAPLRVPLGKGIPPYPKEARVTLTPATWVKGRVTYADTGKPVAHARVQFVQFEAPGGRLEVRTDKDGRYRINPFLDHYFSHTLAALAPEGEPYLAVSKSVWKPRGAETQRVDLALPRGVFVRGRVTEAGSGKPVAGAAVQHVQQLPALPHQAIPARTDARGNFTLVVAPGPGHLLTTADYPDYVPRVIGDNVLHHNRPGGRRWYAHAVTRVQFKPKTGPHTVNFELRRGVVVTGRVLGPDGKPTRGLQLLTPLVISASRRFAGLRPVDLPGSRFTLNACDPDRGYPVIIFDEKKRWGVAVTVSGKQKGKPLTVKLARCGSATVRFLGPDGKPRVGYSPRIEVVLTPGPPWDDFDDIRKRKVLAADDTSILALHYRLYLGKGRDRGVTDARGRFNLPILIPGATYRVFDPNSRTVSYRNFQVKAGEKLNLGDIGKR
jgi:protocatechuate 3,4-dioxygenase beta subunit